MALTEPTMWGEERLIDRMTTCSFPLRVGEDRNEESKRQSAARWQAACCNDSTTTASPTQAARISALRQLVLQAPAQSLGFHHYTTTRIATEAGKTWTRDAPGDHTR